jgi:hypothetical protein
VVCVERTICWNSVSIFSYLALLSFERTWAIYTSLGAFFDNAKMYEDAQRLVV